MTRLALMAAAALLASESAHPVRTDLGRPMRGALREFINQPTAKRAKVKAARKQRRKQK